MPGWLIWLYVQTLDFSSDLDLRVMISKPTLDSMLGTELRKEGRKRNKEKMPEKLKGFKVIALSEYRSYGWKGLGNFVNIYFKI